MLTNFQKFLSKNKFLEKSHSVGFFKKWEKIQIKKKTHF